MRSHVEIEFDLVDDDPETYVDKILALLTVCRGVSDETASLRIIEVPE